MAGFLLVANWKSDVGYAWWLMENFWVQLSKLADRRQVMSYLIYPEITRIPDSISASTLQVHTINYGDNSLSGFLRLARFVFKHHIKYVYLTDRPFLSPKYLALKCLGVRRIIVHDHSPGDRSIATGLKRLIKRTLNEIPWITADAIFAVTPYVQERHLLSSCIPRRKSFIAQNGISPIGRSTEHRHYCHDAFGLPHRATIVLTTGRANPYKQIDFVIQCANVLINQDRIADLYFVYCGDGPDLDRLRNLAKDCSLLDRFIFAGNRSDIRMIAQSCDIGIQASKGEVGYSLSILEYMSAGLATVVPGNPSVCGATRHGETGLLYRENVLESACDALRRLALDSDYRTRLGAAASAAVERDFHLDNTNRQLIAAVSNVFAWYGR